MKIFPTSVKRVAASGPAGFTDAFSLGIQFSDSNVVPTDDPTFAFTFPEDIAGQTDALLLGLQLDDLANAAPTDDTTFLLNLLQEDTNAVPTDVDTYAMALTQGDTVDAQSEAVSLGIGDIGDTMDAQSETIQLAFPAPDFGDTSTVPSDADTYAMTLLQGDTADVQSETAQLAFPAPDFGDTADVQTESRSIVLKAWLSGSAGANVTSPANANGVNDGAVATLTTAVLAPATETLTSTVGGNIPSGITVTAAIYRGWFKSVNVAISSAGDIRMTSSEPTITMFANSALNTTVDRLDGSFTFDLFAAGIDTLAKLQSCQVLHRVTDAAAGVTPHILTVDAGHIEVTGNFL